MKLLLVCSFMFCLSGMVKAKDLVRDEWCVGRVGGEVVVFYRSDTIRRGDKIELSVEVFNVSKGVLLIEKGSEALNFKISTSGGKVLVADQVARDNPSDVRTSYLKLYPVSPDRFDAGGKRYHAYTKFVFVIDDVSAAGGTLHYEFLREVFVFDKDESSREIWVRGDVRLSGVCDLGI